MKWWCDIVNQSFIKQSSENDYDKHEYFDKSDWTVGINYKHKFSLIIEVFIILKN